MAVGRATDVASPLTELDTRYTPDTPDTPHAPTPSPKMFTTPHEIYNTYPCICVVEVNFSNQYHPRPSTPLDTCSCKSQFSHEPVNLSLIIANMKNKVTNLCGNRLLNNDFINTFLRDEN